VIDERHDGSRRWWLCSTSRTCPAFDHTCHRDEMIERWGEDTYERSANWWSNLSDDEKLAHQQAQDEIARDFAAAPKRRSQARCRRSRNGSCLACRVQRTLLGPI
jgi:hypothetical protein